MLHSLVWTVLKYILLVVSHYNFPYVIQYLMAPQYCPGLPERCQQHPPLGSDGPRVPQTLFPLPPLRGFPRHPLCGNCSLRTIRRREKQKISPHQQNRDHLIVFTTITIRGCTYSAGRRKYITGKIFYFEFNYFNLKFEDINRTLSHTLAIFKKGWPSATNNVLSFGSVHFQHILWRTRARMRK